MRRSRMLSGAMTEQNHPNPFNPRTTIRFVLASGGHVTLSIYETEGRLVRTIVDGERASGPHEAQWDGRDGAGNPVGSSVYFYRLTAGKFSSARKMVLLK
ncbi:MAG: T9SS type A sorting domain-containing protein [Candidatus Latescibacteria bacterium]|nr:T9SS type A sorting domain-containing protein [Candidatus Latescibacterota bacterium]